MKILLIDDFADNHLLTRMILKGQAQAVNDAETRRRWRCLAMVIKAKLEVVASGISSFEEEFLAHVMLYDGRTVGGATPDRGVV
jgi:response regulator RpfG family c-di-GMP phosphodiesterase